MALVLAHARKRSFAVLAAFLYVGVSPTDLCCTSSQPLSRRLTDGGFLRRTGLLGDEHVLPEFLSLEPIFDGYIHLGRGSSISS